MTTASELSLSGLADCEGGSFDVVVAGAGIAGMAAAIDAAQQGARVLVLEKDRVIGGNARWAYGFDIEATSFEDMRATNPEGDPALQRILVEEFGASLDWLREQGVRIAEAEPGRFNYVPDQGDGGLEAFAALRSSLLAKGGTVMTDTPLLGLLTDGYHGIRGVVAGAREIEAGAVVLATGGFGGNAGLKRRYLGAWGDRTGFYGTRFHDGDGMLAALSVGAALTKGVSVPAGACIFPPPFEPPVGSFALGAGDKTSIEAVPAGIQSLLVRPPVGCEGSLLLNLDGQRYVDESAPYSYVGWRTTEQRDALGICIFDGPTFEAESAILEIARTHGAVMFEAATIEQLAEQLSGWRREGCNNDGFDASAAVVTIRAFNAAVAAGQEARLAPARHKGGIAIDTPPFVAVPCVQGVNDTAGGIRIDEGAHVLDSRGDRIIGLYAAGADGGRPYSFEHGGLAYGLILGRIAGRNAAGASNRRTTQAHLEGDRTYIEPI